MRRALLTSLLWLLPALAHAHPMAPASLTLRQGTPGGLELSLRATPEAYPLLSVELPAGCAPFGKLREKRDTEAVVGVQALRCEAMPAPGDLGLQGLARAGVDAVVLVERPDGAFDQALLTSSESVVQDVASAVSAGHEQQPVFVRYLMLGFEHLWAGADHILFVLCLLLLVQGMRGAALALTAFTLGHALTLTLSALDLVRLPQAPAEALIAASLVWMAGSVLVQGRSGQYVAPAALGFGLVHGLGFASVLREVGLPAEDTPLSLLAFNLGIEVGQLSLALVAWSGLRLLRSRLAGARLELASAYAVACLTGVLGAFWVFERLS